MAYLKNVAWDDYKLLAFYLGGRATGCQIELHDVAFVVAKSLEEAYPQLYENWFGEPRSLHIDSWYAVDCVGSYSVKVLPKKLIDNSPLKLFFINLGAYRMGHFGEEHIMRWVVAENKLEAKAKAKANLAKELLTLHTDDLYDVDDCIEMNQFENHRILVEKTEAPKMLKPSNGWQRIPPQFLPAES